MDFEACRYNFHWWVRVGLILSVNEPQPEVDVKFMCPHPTAPHGPSPSFYWLEQDGICTICYNQIICAIDTPSASPSGQIYKLFRLSLKTIEQNINI